MAVAALSAGGAAPLSHRSSAVQFAAPAVHSHNLLEVCVENRGCACGALQCGLYLLHCSRVSQSCGELVLGNLADGQSRVIGSLWWDAGRAVCAVVVGFCQAVLNMVYSPLYNVSVHNTLLFFEVFLVDLYLKISS